MVVVAALPRRLRRLALVAGLAKAVVFEAKGPTGPPAPLRGHAVSAAASIVVGVGWTAGAWAAWARSLGRARRRSS
jgi:hypothetical protein